MENIVWETDKIQRILVMGASGSGTTNLGRALANRIATSHFDLDDIFWIPSDPPYTQSRSIPERLALIDQLFLSRPSFILSGSPLGWDITLKPRLQAVIFLYTPPKIRLQRLLAREILRSDDKHSLQQTEHDFSLEKLPESLSDSQKELLAWASHYDDPDFPHRSYRRHTEWLNNLSCPILTVEGTQSIEQLVDSALSFISN